ncbi:hypothetical protein EYS49_14255 [Salmonella enterica]|nr:hypothetical protein [Salmonella enterica]
MQEVKIYTASPSDLSPPVQSESFCVDLVLASDYRELEAKCMELAAESTALKKSEVEFNEYCRRECEDVGDTWVDDFTETPDTDAFLAEVRAQVWIEGSEPAEFGRYWVRYETDVGPHYCSAQWMEHNFCAGSNTNIHKIWLADHSRSINSLRGVTHYTRLPDSLEGAAL